MKNLTLSLLFLSFISTSISQEKVVWHQDLKEAFEVSQKENKPLMLFFTGSDWCGWCVRLQKEVFFQPEFIKWAEQNVVLVELDFPRRKAQSNAIKSQNAQLQQQFQVRGYPTIWFVTSATNSSGQVNLSQLGKTGYVKGGPAAWISSANGILGINNGKSIQNKDVAPKREKGGNKTNTTKPITKEIQAPATPKKTVKHSEKNKNK